MASVVQVKIIGGIVLGDLQETITNTRLDNSGGMH